MKLDPVEVLHDTILYGAFDSMRRPVGKIVERACFDPDKKDALSRLKSSDLQNVRKDFITGFIGDSYDDELRKHFREMLRRFDQTP